MIHAALLSLWSAGFLHRFFMPKYGCWPKSAFTTLHRCQYQNHGTYKTGSDRHVIDVTSHCSRTVFWPVLHTPNSQIRTKNLSGLHKPGFRAHTHTHLQRSTKIHISYPLYASIHEAQFSQRIFVWKTGTYCWCTTSLDTIEH